MEAGGVHRLHNTQKINYLVRGAGRHVPRRQDFSLRRARANHFIGIYCSAFVHDAL